MSLIRIAIMHGFDSCHYCVAVMKAIPHCETVEDYEVLLPWNIKLAKINDVVFEVTKNCRIKKLCYMYYELNEAITPTSLG